ncbi:eukaryotic peptide chain release factor GTP-binding subunit ERF3A-like [Phoenix dactylifera]|uniref:Eukaryotic peptide chain release factor GTP-binding subunit ERF3A-like n=1 Tax=Phoenix dactylifera TaxID=42345 RepID=A0A8B8J1W4_PHODC|nr:eukaryotic peptide chain release factor GTP-binding subunit ERF3A-like [Phoenix dactylifera]XP_026658859.2 eukaryotic peptide chain release factor GTP-binding subunit ERF3A-like [Phoenix dactylifera]
MEEAARAEVAPHPPALVDDAEINDWSKEDDEPMEEVRPPAPAADDTLAPPPAEDVKAILSDLQSLQLETKVKDKETVATEEDEKQDEKEENKKRHLNVVFIGHVDAGKSTTGGQILFLSGQVDDRTMQKYEKEAKDKSRESWYMAYIMDTNEEERIKGKTVEVGRAHFETENTRFTILDAPGHKSYVPNMISGASQADIGVLVISARKGEFETGYERGGQTREHVQLAKTLGVAKLIVVVNKMDDPTVKWSKERFDEIESKMVPFLKSSGYLRKDVQFLPISGLVGTNMKTRVEKSICDWWNGPCLFEVLDSIAVPPRDPKGPLRMPIIDKYREMGTVVMGKIESGSIREGDSLLIMPNKANVKVLAIHCDENKVRCAGPGENVRVKLSGIEEEDILAGFVLSSIANPIGAVTEFNAQLQILELIDNAIFTAGYKAVLHIHAIVEECEIVDLIEEIDLKKKSADPKKKKPKRKPLFVKNGAAVVCRIQVNNLICIENFSDFAQLGRFTLRTEGKTVAIGKVVALPPPGSSAFVY